MTWVIAPSCLVLTFPGACTHVPAAEGVYWGMPKRAREREQDTEAEPDRKPRQKVVSTTLHKC